MELEESVQDRIREATATGFSIEQLSRNMRSSGWLGNSLLFSHDALMGRNPATVLGVIILFLVYTLYSFLLSFFAVAGGS